MKSLGVAVTGFSGVDMVGQSGLEAQYDKQLRGQPGQDEVAVNAAGQVTRTIKQVRPQAGDDLVTSINAQLQAATAERARQRHPQGAGGGEPPGRPPVRRS